jgi:hypothetical protein
MSFSSVNYSGLAVLAGVRRRLGAMLTGFPVAGKFRCKGLPAGSGGCALQRRAKSPIMSALSMPRSVS